MTELENTVLAKFLATKAADVNIDGRWYPRSDVVMTLSDKVEMSVRKHGFRVKAASKAATEALVEKLVERDGFAVQTEKLGSTLFQFKPQEYRAAIDDMKANDADIAPIIAEAEAGGEDFWNARFESLTAKA